MHDYRIESTVSYEDGDIRFSVLYANHTVWISQKELEILYNLTKIQLIPLFKHVFRILSKEKHTHEFYIIHKKSVSQGKPNKMVRAILHYDLDVLCALQTLYPNEHVLEYITTAQSFLESQKKEVVRT